MEKLLLSHHSYKEEWVGHEPDFLVSQKIAAWPLLIFFFHKSWVKIQTLEMELAKRAHGYQLAFSVYIV